MPPPVNPNSDRSIAKKLGVSKNAVNKARKRGVDGKDAETVLEQWDKKTTRQRSDGPVGLPDNDQNRAAIARLNMAKARREEHKAAREEKSVVPAADTETAMRTLVEAIKNQVLTFADECGAAIAAQLGVDAALTRQTIKRHLFAHMAGKSEALKQAA